MVSFRDGDFATAVDKMKERGAELIVGSEAKELLCKMEQAKGIPPRTDKAEKIWEVQNWGEAEWAEQAMAELAFSKSMNVQHFLDPENLSGLVAGYRVRRAANALVLVPSDCDEDIFVAVKVERAKRQAQVLGWLRGSEGKSSEFYQKNCWVIPPDVLHDMEKLPPSKKVEQTK